MQERDRKGWLSLFYSLNSLKGWGYAGLCWASAGSLGLEFGLPHDTLEDYLIEPSSVLLIFHFHRWQESGY